MKIKPFVTGIIASVSVIPLWIALILFDWFMVMPIVTAMHFELAVMQEILLWATVILFAIPFLPSLAALVHSLIKIKERWSWIGTVLSLLGILESVAILVFFVYLGGIA